jgi:hypothetical protein
MPARPAASIGFGQPVVILPVQAELNQRREKLGGAKKREGLQFTSTGSRCDGDFLYNDRIRSMISAARFPYFSILTADARARSRAGGSWLSHSTQVLALVMAAAIGCLISWANDAAISPNMLTRLMCARSSSSRHNFSRSCSARLRSSMSVRVPPFEIRKGVRCATSPCRTPVHFQSKQLRRQ